MLQTGQNVNIGPNKEGYHRALRQNSSMISADLRPQRYRPLKRRSRPTHDRKPSMDGATIGRKSAFRQFKITATSVRPA